MNLIKDYCHYIVLLVVFLLLAACNLDKSIISDAQKSPASVDSSGSLKDGIWFKNMAVGTTFFAAKPNEETDLMTMQGVLFARSDDSELTSEQLKRVTFKLTGANAELFSLQEKKIASAPDGAKNAAMTDQTVLVFNKGMAFFYDEVKKRCRICNVTLIAELDNGTQASAEISLRLLEVDAFALTSIHNANSVDKQDRFTIKVNAFAKEGELNHLYVLSSNLVKGRGVPSASLFKGSEHDLNGDGFVDPSEAQHAAEKAFWKDAIPSGKALRQAKYDTFSSEIDAATGFDYSQDLDLFSLDFHLNNSWFDNIKKFNLTGKRLGISGVLDQRIEEFKAKQANQLLPVLKFNAPRLTEDQRTGRTCTVFPKKFRYYISSRPYKVNITIISTDEESAWLKMEVSVYVIGSDDENYSILDHYVNKRFNLDYYRICLGNEDKQMNPGPLPSIEILPNVD